MRLHDAGIRSLEEYQCRSMSNGLEHLRRNLIHHHFPLVLGDKAVVRLFIRQVRLFLQRLLDAPPYAAVVIEHVGPALGPQHRATIHDKLVPVRAVDSVFLAPRDIRWNVPRLTYLVHPVPDLELFSCKVAVPITERSTAITYHPLSIGDRYGCRAPNKTLGDITGQVLDESNSWQLLRRIYLPDELHRHTGVDEVYPQLPDPSTRRRSAFILVLYEKDLWSRTCCQFLGVIRRDVLFQGQPDAVVDNN